MAGRVTNKIEAIDVRGLHAKDEQYVWHAMQRHLEPRDGEGAAVPPPIVESGCGAWIEDVEGRRFLDAMSGLFCVNVGYGREELARAAYDQMCKLSYQSLLGAHRPAVELAERLSAWLGDEYVAFFAVSGSEANETAFKLARQYHQQTGNPGRWKFIARYRGYHGNSLGALSATGQAMRRYRYEPLAPGFVHVAPPDRYRCGYCGDQARCSLQCAREIDRTIEWELPETIAGVIAEPIITGGGVLVPPEEYLAEVAAICRRTGALLICDEVISGFGRTGQKFGFQHFGVTPDIVNMAKGLTSGYMPLAVTAVRREIFDRFRGVGEYDHFRHISTFGGLPAACALALRNLDILEEEGLVQRSAQMGDMLRSRLDGLRAHPRVGDIRGRGLIVGLELVADKKTKVAATDEVLAAVVASCRGRGVIVGKTTDAVAGQNNVLTLAPPLVTSEEDLIFLADVVEDAISAVE